jgi:hypothetical protein
MGPTLLGLEHARACTGHYGAAWTSMQKTLRWLESLKQVRYQLIAYDFLGHVLLDIGLNEQAASLMEDGLALARDTGINFWRAAIESHLAIARARLGEKDAASGLQTTLDGVRRARERYLMGKCLEALSEIALRQGASERSRAYADELLALAKENGLREREASARSLRGSALITEGAHAEAHAELSCAAALAAEIGHQRLAMDAEAALFRLSRARGQGDAAERHGSRANRIAEAIAKSLERSGLEARLHPTSDLQ